MPGSTRNVGPRHPFQPLSEPSQRPVGILGMLFATVIMDCAVRRLGSGAAMTGRLVLTNIVVRSMIEMLNSTTSGTQIAKIAVYR
jgi:hypothetical protein